MKSNRIPLIIHQIQENDCNAIQANILDTLSKTWKQKHPIWEYRLWEANDLKNVILEYAPELEDILNDNMLLKKIARYFILYQNGGLFIDSDFECLKSFDALTSHNEFCIFASCNNHKVVLLDSIIASKKGHPFLKGVIQQIIKEKKALMNGNFSISNKKSYKKSITILPYKMIYPCSKDEIILYSNGLLPEKYIQKKISKAYSICYYRTDTRAIKKTKTKNANILYVSTSITEVGGAYSAAQRIYFGLRKINLNTKMLVLDSIMSEKENIDNDIFIADRKKNELYGYNNDMKFLKDYPYYSISSHGFSPAMVGVNLAKNIEQFNPNIVMLQGINGGFVTIENMSQIKRKIIWILPDCWAFTGGCYYNGKCKRYQIGCGKCPKLGSNNENDLSHQIWKRKEKA